VANRTFSSQLIQRVLPAFSTDEITNALSGLLARDMIAPASGGAFTFHNGLVFDITYGTLSRAERIRLHKAVAAALVEEAGVENVDDYTHLLAYHYYKVAQLLKLSAVPHNLAIETEHAITYQVRAAELAVRSGAVEEAQSYFQRAIDLAADAEKVELYEKMADSLERQWQIKIRAAYQDALALWRTLPEPQPLVGARLIRKLIILNNRYYFADKMSKEEAELLWQEAMQLVQQAGDEGELWRVRTAALFMQYDLDPLSVEEMKQSERVRDLKHLAVDAAGYFEERRDWEALSETLDGLTVLQFRSMENSEAMATIQRRLRLPDLSFRERADAISSLSAISLLSGDYDTTVQVVADALDKLHPGEPLEVFGNTLNGPIGALYMTARWSEIPRFQRALDEVWERTKDIPGTEVLTIGSYSCLLLIALSREDQAQIEVIEPKLRKTVPEWKDLDTLPLVEFYRDGNFSQFSATPGNRGTDVAGWMMMLFAEHGQCPPEDLIKMGDYFGDDLTIQVTSVVRALAAGDDQALSQAIDEAEKHHLIVHAARMRIILAKRTGDLSQLERARPVLERLDDRLFLRSLREVEGQLRVPGGLPTG
jgi:tetratricopeptide (TPR) repeat protein